MIGTNIKAKLQRLHPQINFTTKEEIGSGNSRRMNIQFQGGVYECLIRYEQLENEDFFYVYEPMTDTIYYYG